jgi:hypothetical protein
MEAMSVTKARIDSAITKEMLLRYFEADAISLRRFRIGGRHGFEKMKRLEILATRHIHQALLRSRIPLGRASTKAIL